MAGRAGDGGGRRAPKAGARRADPRRDELLSAYLDGQLSEAARARLEQRLSADAELLAELGALRRTIALVRELPPVTLPRHFVLSPAAVERGERARRSPQTGPARLSRAAPWLTAATAAVATMLAVVLAGHVLLAGPALAPAALAPAVPSEERTAVEVTEEPLLMVAEEAPPESEAPAAERAFDLAQQATAVAAAPTETPMTAAESMAVPEDGTPAASAPKAAITEAPALAAPPAPAEETPVEGFQALEAQPVAPEAEAEGQLPEAARSDLPVAPAEEEREPLPAGEATGRGQAGALWLWLAIEALLAIGAVALAALTILAWAARGRHDGRR